MNPFAMLGIGGASGITPAGMTLSRGMAAGRGSMGAMGGMDSIGAGNPFMFGGGMPQPSESFGGPGAGFANFGATVNRIGQDRVAQEAEHNFTAMHQQNMASGMPWDQSILNIFQQNPEMLAHVSPQFMNNLHNMREMEAQPSPDEIKSLRNSTRTVTGPNGEKYLEFYDEKAHLSHIEKPEKYVEGHTNDGGLYMINPSNPADRVVVRAPQGEPNKIMADENNLAWAVGRDNKATPITDKVNGQQLKLYNPMKEGGEAGKSFTTQEQAQLEHAPEFIKNIQVLADAADRTGVPDAKFRQLWGEYVGTGDRTIAWTVARERALSEMAQLEGSRFSNARLKLMLDSMPTINEAPTFSRAISNSYLDDLRDQGRRFIDIVQSDPKKKVPDSTIQAYADAGVPVGSHGDMMWQLRKDPSQLSDDQLKQIGTLRTRLSPHDYAAAFAEASRRGWVKPSMPTGGTPLQSTPQGAAGPMPPTQ